MKKFPVSRKLIIVSLITISALLATACQSRPTKVDSTTKDNSTNSATTTYQDKTEENTSSNADESTTVNGELSGESTGDITTEGSGDETTNIGDAETNNGSIDNSDDNSTEASTDDVVETTTQKPAETTTPKPTETTTPKPTETTTPKPTEPPTPDFLEQIALTDAEKAEGFSMTSFREKDITYYYKYRMEEVGGKAILRYKLVGRSNSGYNFVLNEPDGFILDFGPRIIASDSLDGLSYPLFRPVEPGYIHFYWTSGGMQFSHYYQGASMRVYLPWSIEGSSAITCNPNGTLISRDDYLWVCSLYGNNVPDEYSNLDPSGVWTYDEISIEYEIAYDLYVFHEQYLKGTDYEPVGIRYSDYVANGLQSARYESLNSGGLYELFIKLLNNQ